MVMDPELEKLMAEDNFAELGQRVQSLMRLPQGLCKTRGNCCRVVTYKGSLGVEEISELACSDSPQSENAQDFLTLFEPYASQDDAREIAPMFVEQVRQTASEEAQDDISFFRCRFLGDTGQCRIWEDRPTGCRMYPFPHEKTIYHPGCGFAKAGHENVQKIQTIIQFFERREGELKEQSEHLQ